MTLVDFYEIAAKEMPNSQRLKAALATLSESERQAVVTGELDQYFAELDAPRNLENRVIEFARGACSAIENSVITL